MKYSTLLFHSLPFLVIPSLILYPQVDLPAVTFQPQASSVSIEADLMFSPDYLFTYDDVLDLLEELEDGDLEQRCSLVELNRISHFIALLAKNGVMPNETNEEFTLANDIQELLSEETPYQYAFSVGEGEEFTLVPSVMYSNAEMLLCKSWIHKKWD